MKNYFKNKLSDIKEKQLYRELKRVESAQNPKITLNGKEIINFSSNNYLDLSTNNEIISSIQQATQEWGTGSGASRLISGNLSLYEKLEKKMSSFKERQSALVYTCGYMANTGIISSLAEQEHAIIIDRLNHASIIDGTKLSKARRFVYKHADPESLEKTLKRCSKYKIKFVITDTVFSMDGDVAPLKEICALCDKYDAGLIVDEAHAIGVFGDKGQGMMAELNLKARALIDMGTFSKAAAGLGGYVCCDKIVRDYLVNTSRSLIYTTGLTPGILAGNLKAIEVIEKAHEKREHLKTLSSYLRSELKSRGFDTGNSTTQIIPVVFKHNEKTLNVYNYLLEHGVFVPAIRFPTVPRGSARLRISLTSGHTKSHVDYFLSLLDNFKEL